MITVSILVNGQPVMARSAVNTMKKKKLVGHWATVYQCDDGKQILHDPDDGAVALAKKLLDTIKEPKKKAKSQ